MPGGPDFGYTVSLRGGYVLVGAPLEGRAYLFNLTTGALTRFFSSPNPLGGSAFGRSAWVSGNYLVIGAPLENAIGDNATVEAGNAYVFEASTGHLISNLTSPNPQTGGIFGSSVAMFGGLVAIVAPGQSGYEVYLFNVTGSLLFRFAVPNPSGARYGVSVNDKYLALSATLVSTSGKSQAGAVYVFSTTNCALLASIESPRSQIDGEFGYSTSLSGSRLLVGAAQEDSGSTALAGNAYVFELPA